MAVTNSKRLVAAFLQFMDAEMQKETFSAEDKQGMEVACQCLQAAYTVTATDVPMQQKSLEEIFLAACPQTVEKTEVSAEDKEKAEQFKLEGNGFMKQQKFDDAIQSYNKAIEIDPKNAVFYCNRAAAQTGKEAFDRALTDCRKALEIDPDYSKAYSRMGLTYSKMEAYDSAVECYEKALKLDPENTGYKNNLEIAQKKSATPPMAGFPGGFPGMPNMPGMGNMAEMMSNPQFMQMAKTVMEDPQMKAMAQQMMGSMMNPPPQGGNSEGGEGATQPPVPSMERLMGMGQQFAEQMMQSNPEVIERLRKNMADNMNTDQQQPPTNDDKEN